MCSEKVRKEGREGRGRGREIAKWDVLKMASLKIDNT